MTTSFSSLPLVDLSILSQPSPTEQDLTSLSQQLCNVFATTGFAYLVNSPLTFDHEGVFDLASDFFRQSEAEKLSLAKKTFVTSNSNTYRGYFPCQPGQSNNLKEGFEIGAPQPPRRTSVSRQQKFNLAEPNVWPKEESFQEGRLRLERLYAELQSLSGTLLSLLAVGLGKPADYFSSYLDDSLSTLRLLHYPPQDTATDTDRSGTKLCCTPHTDSGILTLLHQDTTGGLEVLNADEQWVAAPYVPGSIVVNIGDLMAQVSGGRFVATMHRVRTSSSGPNRPDGMGRFSVPFFFEPGEQCVVKSIASDDSIVYGEWIRRKMGTWVEYQDVEGKKLDENQSAGLAVEAF